MQGSARAAAGGPLRWHHGPWQKISSVVTAMDAPQERFLLAKYGAAVRGPSNHNKENK